MTYAFSLAIEPLAWEAAHAVGLGRTLIKKLRGRQAWEGRGEHDERIDTEGALAEILLSQLLDKAGATLAPLVAHKPDFLGVDILLAGKRLDVKSIGQGRASCNINAKQHAAKYADAYLLVRLTRSDVADVFVVSQAGVSSWDHRTEYNRVPMEPGRHYYTGRLPTTLPALAEIEA
jgi:hypothetical protein